MKTLQSNYTTPKQSKILLELGLPVDSADCYLNGDSVIMLNGKTFQENYNEDLDLARLHLVEYPHYIPCWSVGRLIEIMLNSQIDTGTYTLGLMLDKDMFSMESLIDIIDEDIKEFDFSKLEE